MEKYIHYGHSSFNADRFDPVRNMPGRTKPIGGFWASPEDSRMGWKWWCDEEEWYKHDMNKHFVLSLKDDSNILHIHSLEDLDGMPEQAMDRETTMFCPDFEKMLNDGIDAIEFHYSEDSRLRFGLYEWDCDSILIMNPDAVSIA